MSSFVQYVRVSPWWLAALMALGASFFSGRAAVEIRQSTRIRGAMMSMVFADLTLLLCIPSLSPALVTSISGFSMITILLFALGAERARTRVKLAGGLIAASVAVIAVDISVAHDRVPSDSRPDLEAAFWIVMASIGVLSAISSFLVHIPIFRRCLMVGCGFQSVTTMSLVYVLTAPGPTHFDVIPVLMASAMFNLYLTRVSLSVNRLEWHLPIEFSVFNAGTWLFADRAIHAVTIHGGVASIVATCVCVSAACLIMMIKEESKFR